MSQNTCGDGQPPVTTCSTTAEGTGSLSSRTRIRASSNIAPTVPASAPTPPYRGADDAAPDAMFIEGTITRSVDGRTVAVPFSIDTRTGLWRHWGPAASGATADVLTALRNAACDLA
jgi:hypothetical protein